MTEQEAPPVPETKEPTDWDPDRSASDDEESEEEVDDEADDNE